MWILPNVLSQDNLILLKIYIIMRIGLFILLAFSTIQAPESNFIEVSMRSPDLTSCWEDAPSIRVCDGINIPRSRIEKAVRFWKKIGYSFGPIFYDNKSAACISDGLTGEIRIGLPEQGFDFNNLAVTKTTKFRENNLIIYSQIDIQENKVLLERVLEHEIGHALGWQHTGRSNHIMNRLWERGGVQSYGVEHSVYKKRCSLIAE